MLMQGVQQDGHLFGCGFEPDPDRSLHGQSISYSATYCKRKGAACGRVAFLPALKRRGFHATTFI
jgi:hypothetical protein